MQSREQEYFQMCDTQDIILKQDRTNSSEDREDYHLKKNRMVPVLPKRPTGRGKKQT